MARQCSIIGLVSKVIVLSRSSLISPRKTPLKWKKALNRTQRRRFLWAQQLQRIHSLWQLQSALIQIGSTTPKICVQLATAKLVEIKTQPNAHTPTGFYTPKVCAKSVISQSTFKIRLRSSERRNVTKSSKSSKNRLSRKTLSIKWNKSRRSYSKTLKIN